MWAIYTYSRDIARRTGLGRVRDWAIKARDSKPYWTAVPPQRIKDLDPDGSVAPAWVALTFDDGPDPYVTPPLLEILGEHSARATFFMCGLAAERHPEIVKDVLSAGHTIGGHSWDHPNSGIRNLTEDERRRQIDDTQDLLSELAGRPVTLFRPPRGITDKKTWRAFYGQGLTTVLWSVHGRDWEIRDPDEIADRFLDMVRPGSVGLLHDANANFIYSTDRPGYGDWGNQETTIEATELILLGLANRGLASLAIDDLPTNSMASKGRLRPAGLKPGFGR